MKEKLSYKPVYIEWVDSTQQDGWVWNDDITQENALIKSLGFVVYEDEKAISIAGSYSEEQVMAPLIIPKCAIKWDSRAYYEVKPSIGHCEDNLEMVPSFEGEIKGFEKTYLKPEYQKYKINEILKKYDCQHESDGYCYDKDGEHVLGYRLQDYEKQKCKKCGEFYR